MLPFTCWQARLSAGLSLKSSVVGRERSQEQCWLMLDRTGVVAGELNVFLDSVLAWGAGLFHYMSGYSFEVSHG